MVTRELPDAVRCCIAGGGPAGMMLGFLLAFRGDTIHPSTLDLIYELGLLDAFLALPHDEITHLSAVISGTRVAVADFSHSPTHCKFLGFMPQWDFLNFLATHAKGFST